MARLLICLAVTVVSLCGRHALADDKDRPEKADIRGKVSRITPANDDVKKRGFVGNVLVEGVKEETTNYDKAAILVTTKTTITKKTDKEKKACKFEDIKKGAKVQVDFTGPVAESYPVQATAKSIVILEDPK
jgi:beta-N-acetylhexosaminidase